MEQVLQSGSRRLGWAGLEFFLPISHWKGMKRLNASLSDRQRALLSSYMLSIEQGPAAVREMIMFDMRGFFDLGIPQRAADLKAVLNAFSNRYPEARVASRSKPNQNLCRCDGMDLAGVRAPNGNGG